MATEHLTQLFKLQIEIIQDVKKNKQKLIEIILENTTAEILLTNLRRYLLESQIEKESHILYPSFVSKITELSPDQINDIRYMMKKTFDPLVERHKLMEKIGEIIRSENTNEDKINLISDLLI
jgi:hypothetical protein